MNGEKRKKKESISQPLLDIAPRTFRDIIHQLPLLIRALLLLNSHQVVSTSPRRRSRAALNWIGRTVITIGVLEDSGFLQSRSSRGS